MRFKKPKPIGRARREYDMVIRTQGDRTGLSTIASQVFDAIALRMKNPGGLDMQVLERELGFSEAERMDAMDELIERGLVCLPKHELERLKKQ